MFLVQISARAFIDANKIESIEVDLIDETLEVTMSGNSENTYLVIGKYRNIFLNHVQALNDNIASIEAEFNLT